MKSSSRGFAIVGWVSFLSIGETSKAGDLKRECTLANETSETIEVFALGNKHVRESCMIMIRGVGSTVGFWLGCMSW